MKLEKSKKVSPLATDYYSSDISMAVKRGYITQRHTQILHLCYDHGFLKVPDVGEVLRIHYHFGTEASRLVTAHRILSTLVKYGFLEIFKPRFQMYHHYNVTSQGVRFLQDCGLVPANAQYNRPDESTLNHESLVTKVRFLMEQSAGFKDWNTSRRMYLNAKNDQKIPDLEALIFSSKADKDVKIGMEIELTRKTNARYRKIFEQYKYSDYDLVFFFVLKDSLKKILLGLSEGVTRKIYVTRIDEFFEKGLDTELFSNDENFRLSQIAKAA